MNSQKVYHCGVRCATLRKRESNAPIIRSMRRNRCGSHRHHTQSAVIVVSESRRERCADDAECARREVEADDAARDADGPLIV